MIKKINIISVIIIVLILLGWYFEFISPYYLVPIAILYLIINIVGAANIQLNYFFHSHCSSTTTKKEIAITFDDGPHPDITPKLVKLLETYNTPATFFCIGENISAFPEIVTNIVNSGHIIGTHSYFHGRLFDLQSAGSMQKEIVDTNRAIELVTGKSPVFFRPPYGVTNPMLKKSIAGTNMISIGWSLRSLDTVRSGDKVLSKLKTRTKPGDIVLFHDTNPNIIIIIEDYLNWLHKNDYKVVSLTSLLKITAYED